MGASFHDREKISGDTIKGTFTIDWMGHTRTKGWEAERLKEQLRMTPRRIGA
jgi:hypothetical protein